MKRLIIKILPKAISSKIEGRENLMNVLNNSGWLFFDKILRMGVGLLVGVWIARYLGPEKYGILNNALAFTTLFAALATIGLESFVIQDILKKPKEQNVIVGTSFYLKLFAGIITYILAVICVFFLKPSNEDLLSRYLVYIISIGIIFQSFDVIDYYFQSQVKSKYTVFAKNSAFLLINGIKVYLLLIGAPLIYFGWMWMLELFFNAVGLVYVYKKRGEQILKWKFDWTIAKNLLMQSWPIYIAYISTFIYMKIDQVMIGKMLDNTAAGIYAASTKVYEIPFFIIMVISSSIFPSLVKMYELQDKNVFFRKYEQITALYSFLGYILLIGTFLLGKYVIKILFGENYLGAFSVLNIQMFGMFFLFNAGLRSSYLAIAQKQKIIMLTSILSAIMNIILNFYLIPVYRVEGAAIATTITQGVSLLALNIFFTGTRRILNIQLKSLILLPLFKQFKR